MKTTWRKELVGALADNGETWADVISNTMSENNMDEPFDDGLGESEGCAFTVWTTNRVYFPAAYDGSEWVESVSRNPDGKATNHVGGE